MKRMKHMMVMASKGKKPTAFTVSTERAQQAAGACDVKLFSGRNYREVISEFTTWAKGEQGKDWMSGISPDIFKPVDGGAP
jgi:hypothetical protein